MTILLALAFYLVYLVFGLIGLPLATRIFQSRPAAVAAAKPMGLFMFGYLVWLLSYLKILNYQNRGLIFSAFILCAGLGLYLSGNFFKSLGKKAESFKKNSPLVKILIMEGLAFLAFAGYLILRSHNGAINGTERFMDMAFLSAAGKSEYFPFTDPWYAGHAVNYYYYGSYLMSLISNLANVSYNFSYNFALGLIFSQTALLSSILGYLLTRVKKLAILAAFLIAASGSLFYAGCSLKASLAETPGQCSYASSTRLYTPSYIINEIPSYSFTVGDLHAHLLALPFFLFCLLLFYALAKLEKPFWPLNFLLGLSLASSGMINAWDMISLGSLFGLIMFIKIWLDFKQGKNFARALKFWAPSLVFVIALAGVFIYPALRQFHNPSLGLGFAPAYVAKYNLSNVQWPTPLLAEIGMWGVLVVAAILASLFKAKEFLQNKFILAMLVLGVGIILGVEIFFVRDIYSVANPSFFRANTTFKFGYHAWVVLCLVFAYSVFLLTKKDSSQKLINAFKPAKWLVIFAVAGGIIYPYQAIKQFYLSNTDKNIGSLDGQAWMQTANLGDLEAVKYINENFKKREVIAEAVGDSYTTYARITTFTGMITPMGWQTHEWTWRFKGENAKNIQVGQQVETGWGDVAKVVGDIERLYSSADPATAKNILEKYKIAYVYIGGLERQKYPGLREENLLALGEKVFEKDGSLLIRIK